MKNKPFIFNFITITLTGNSAVKEIEIDLSVYRDIVSQLTFLFMILKAMRKRD